MRREPYWRSLSPGFALGYRKLSTGGTWIARQYRRDIGRRYCALGATDDVAEADGQHVLSFAQAQAAARAWLVARARSDRNETESGPYTVGNALDDYIADYERRGGKAVDRVKVTIEAHIRAGLGALDIGAISRRRIETWHAKLAETPPRLRTKKGAKQRHRSINSGVEAVRQRRSTANRVLTILKAALNLAHKNRRADAPEAWATVKSFREVDAPKIRYLTDAEAKRLVNACPADFRRLVTAAVLTGARYGELAVLIGGDFNPDSGTLYVRRSKSGKARHIHLTEEGQRFFVMVTAGKSGDALLFPRADGGRWGQAHQARPIKDACKAAKIAPAMAFNGLRHTYASRLAMRAVPMQVIAQQLGHADTRMVEKHYAHLAPSYVGDTVRAAAGSLDIVPPSNLVPIA